MHHLRSALLPTARALRPWALATLLLGALAASAQVTRCIDPHNGHLSYTDGECPKGQSATELQRAPTAAEQASDRERVRQAREQWQAEQLRQQKLAPPIPAAVPPPSTEQLRAQACSAAQSRLQALSSSGTADITALDAAQRNMEIQCLGPDAYAALERERALGLGDTTVVLPHHLRPLRPRPPLPQEPIQRLNCNVFRCYDQHGNPLPAPRPGEPR